MRHAVSLVVVAATLTCASQAWAGSLYSGPGHRPGPDILYRPPLTPSQTPQLQNTGIWHASPILISGASAYRGGEYLYQDFLYDDHGANGGSRDGNDPRTAAAHGDLFSNPNGTYTYPSASGYADNAADFVEVRIRRVTGATAFRVTLNTLKDPSLIAFSFALGNGTGVPAPFPYGANATSPADAFLTVRPSGSSLVGDVRQPVTNALLGAASVSVDRGRRQIEVRVPDSAWTPSGTELIRGGIGLWNKSAGAYLIPQGSRDATHPGGRGTIASPPAFFNVAFRSNNPSAGNGEPFPDFGSSQLFTNTAQAAWWRDRNQGQTLANNGAGNADIGKFHADVNFGKLAAGTTDNGGVPRTGPMDRILASHFEFGQGLNYANPGCGDNTRTGCKGELTGRLQPYAIYVPTKPRPGSGYPLTLLLHALSAGYNQYTGSRHQRQVGERGPGSIVITPAGRGPDAWYYDYGAADTFEVWADVASHYQLDPGRTTISGYSMGGYGTFKFATQYPDLFARAMTIVGVPGVGIWVPPADATGGESTNTNHMLPSVRNIPFLMWYMVSDELVPYAGARQQGEKLDSLGYRYELDSFTPGEHLTFAINDEYGPAAAFLGNPLVNRNPPHVTYVVNPSMDFPANGTIADHAYWLSGLKVRRPTIPPDAPNDQIDVFSRGFGLGDPRPGPTQHGGGTLTGGNLPAIAYSSQARRWGRTPHIRRRNQLDLTAKNISRTTINVDRARVHCNARVTLDTDGPMRITLTGHRCHRLVNVRCVRSRGRARGTRLGAARLGRTRRRQRRVFHGKARLRSRHGIDRYCVNGGGDFSIGYPTRRLSRRQRARARHRAILILTTSRRFSVRGIRRGSRVRTLRRRLHRERRYRVGRNTWYVASGRRSKLVFRTRGRRVIAVGIANRRLMHGRRATRRFLRSWERRHRRRHRH